MNAKAKPIKKQKSKLSINIFIYVLLALAIAFCIYKVIALIQNPTDTFLVEQGKIYEEERVAGYVIRQETLVKGDNYKNGMEQIKTEGERVAKDEAIFRYYTNGEENLLKKIADLDEKISEAMEKEEGILVGDIKTLDKQIESDIISLYQVNDMQKISEVKKQIANSITKKAKIAGDYSPAGSYLKKLVNERSQYENELNEGAEKLTAPISGVVSYKIDGYEDVLVPSNFEKYTTEFLENLNIKTGQTISDSKEGAKIINNFKFYIACSLNSKQALNAKLKDKVTLRFQNDIEVSSKITNILTEEDKVVIIFEVEKQVQELIGYRKTSFDIIWWSDSGKKIPNESIAKEKVGENEISYVIRNRGGYTDKIWVKELRNNGKYTIVENYNKTELQELGFSSEEIKNRSTLKLYDEILRKPTNN